MSENKKYYWLKLKEDFFDDETIRFIEEQPNGVLYSNFYLKLCLKSLKTNGKLIRMVGETLIPYDENALARLTGVDIDTVRCAMHVLKSIGTVKILESGEIYLSQVEEMVGKETEKAVSMRRLRAENKKSGNGGVTMLPECYPDVTPALPECYPDVTPALPNVTPALPICYPEIEIETRDRDKSLEIETRDRDRDKSTEKEVRGKNPPCPPSWKDDPELSGKMVSAISEWIEYKKERRETYKPTGLKSLISQIKNQIKQYGEDPVIDVMVSSMGSNYKGICFDKLKNNGWRNQQQEEGNPFLEILREEQEKKYGQRRDNEGYGIV